MGRSGREKSFGGPTHSNRSQPDTWQAPSKEEKEVARRSRAEKAIAQAGATTVEMELFAATLNRSLPEVDFHGAYTEDVAGGIDDLLNANGSSCVRIIFGHGTGAIERTVMQYLSKIKAGKNPRIIDFKRDASTASVVVKVK